MQIDRKTDSLKLMIGDWAYTTDKHETIIDIHDLIEIESGTIQVVGIPLTEEWLLKFGFEEDPSNNFFSFYLSDYDENEFSRQRMDYWFRDEFSAAELCRAGVCFKRVKIQYVHQLQNLYHALTGEELKIKKRCYEKNENKKNPKKTEEDS